ncbi:MAG: RIP metalloprotease RseP [Bauldia sp.]|nr:RIP metalloprotease RseP [Bauldia sp.]
MTYLSPTFLDFLWGVPLAFAVVVFIHELGHFLVARWFGVGVQTFSLGFGPELVGFTDRRGTRWRISAIPLGGYVRFVGDQNVASLSTREALAELPEAERARLLVSKPVGQRAAVYAAGPFANFLLAIAIFAILFSAVGERVIEPRIDAVIPGQAAEAAGFEAGDLIVAIDGRRVESFNEFQRIVSTSTGETLSVTVDRAGTALTLAVVPQLQEATDPFGNVARRAQIGVQTRTAPEDVVTVHYSVPAAIAKGFGEVWFVIEATFSYLGKVVTGVESLDQLGGPISVAQAAGQAASLGFLSLLSLIAFVSVSIGLVNLFPIPILDGGHLAFCAYEAIRRRPPSDRALEISLRVGLAALLTLVIFATWNDLT